MIRYSLQFTRFLTHLLNAGPGSFVSMESLDDVGIEYEDGTFLGEQAKSVTGKENPISDRAVDFWKTFSNWINAAIKNELPPSTSKYIIYISQPKEGEIAEMFSKAASIDEAKKVLGVVKQEIWGNAPDYEKRESVSSSLSE